MTGTIGRRAPMKKAPGGPGAFFVPGGGSAYLMYGQPPSFIGR